MIDIKATRKKGNTNILTVQQFEAMVTKPWRASKPYKARELFVFLVALGITYREFLSVDRTSFTNNIVMVTKPNQPGRHEVRMTPLAKWYSSKHFLGFPPLTALQFNQGLRVVGFSIGLPATVKPMLLELKNAEAICPLYLIATTQLIKSNHIFLKSAGAFNKVPVDKQYKLFK